MNQHLINALNGHSLAVDNGKITTFNGHGVADLYRLITEEPETLAGASVADKVVGKAAAALMILGGVKELYAATISELALSLLAHSAVSVAFAQRVPHIANHAGTGWCPLETACRDCATARQCLTETEKFIKTK